METIAELKYRKLREIGIGQGANSRVFLADEPQLGGLIAVKEIEIDNDLQLSTMPVIWMLLREFNCMAGILCMRYAARQTVDYSVSKYYAEAKAMFAAGHPNIVPVQYACLSQDRKHVSIAMPYFSSGSLAERISSGSISLKEVIRIGLGVLTGLTFIHIKNYLHFDIKPSNILFDNSDTPLVADFGQAQLLGRHGVVDSLPALYPSGIPPEAFLSGTASVPFDIYQVGLLLYRAVNSDPHFNAQIPPDEALRDQTVSGNFPDRKQFMPHVPSRLRRAICTALEVDPTKRFSSAFNFTRELSKIEITKDWEMSFIPNQGIEWNADQGIHRPSLKIKLLEEDETARYKIEIYSDRSGKLTRKNTDTWKSGLTYKQAFSHLHKKVFYPVGQK